MFNNYILYCMRRSTISKLRKSLNYSQFWFVFDIVYHLHTKLMSTLTTNIDIYRIALKYICLHSYLACLVLYYHTFHVSLVQIYFWGPCCRDLRAYNLETIWIILSLPEGRTTRIDPGLFTFCYKPFIAFVPS